MKKIAYLTVMLAGGMLVYGCHKSRPYYNNALQTAHHAPAQAMPDARDSNTETYDHFVDNPYRNVHSHPLSTFAADVDTVSYSNIRRFLNQGELPPPGAVRVEEMINYFPYDYPSPDANRPYSLTTEIAQAPWKPDHLLLRIGLQATPIKLDRAPPVNLVFLLDVSGSMSAPNKLPLLQRALRLVVEQLDEKDRVAMVVYAGSSGVVLRPTAGNQRAKILAAIDRLEAGGSTNGASGIQLAYALADEYRRPGTQSRVILATDGDFNVGTTSQSELIRLIETKRASGTFLTVLGFGMGNYKDSTLEKLANHGNGNYSYIDTIAEARKVLVQELGATLVTIAQDVKLQVEFNPKRVSSYRLIGYENRMLQAQDFKDDSKDAGDMGAGHSVTALYEIVPSTIDTSSAAPIPLKYQKTTSTLVPAPAGELLTIKTRFKIPGKKTSTAWEQPVTAEQIPTVAQSSRDFRFAAAVAAFGMLLRNPPMRAKLHSKMVHNLAEQGRGADPNGYRREFLGLVANARKLIDEKI